MSESEQVAISSIRTHPMNPNQGHIDTIMESLRVNGMYKPILVHKETRNIIAGNSTYKAAKKLGWSTVSVVWFSGTDKQALVLMLEDNRSSDSGMINMDAAYALAQSLPSLEATGYTVDDFDIPEIDLDLLPEPKEEAEPKVKDDNSPVRFCIGKSRGALGAPEYGRWRAQLPKRNSEAIAAVLDALGVIVSLPPASQANDLDVSWAEIDSLVPFPGNPNEGDVGLLTELLRVNGQVRPIVVNRRTSRILAGNHLTLAAKALGWKKIQTSWVDVDSDTEKRIVLVDNRSRELATTNLDDLGKVLSVLNAEEVTRAGFTLSDLDDVLSGTQLKPPAYTKGETRIQIGTLKASIKTEALIDLNLTAGQELIELAAMLGIDPSQVVQL